MPHPPITKHQIQTIWQEYNLGEVHGTTPIAAGSRNQAFYVNNDFVLRINTLDPHLPKFRNEKAALDLLAGSDLPVPRGVLLDESRRLIPYDLIVLTRLSGTSIAESKDKLSIDLAQRLAFESGKLLARLHQYTFTAFGDIADLETQPFNTWSLFFQDYAQRYLEDARRFGLLEDQMDVLLLEILARLEPILAKVQTGVFVHSDYHYENILHEGGRLTGRLDFEWSFAGDPATDFVPVGERQRILPNSEAAFTKGYQTAEQFDPDFGQRVALYRLFLDLEDAVTCRRLEDNAGAEAARGRLEAGLQSW